MGVPNRLEAINVLTNPSLDVSFLRKNETIATLVLEKYQRFSSSLPATYLVAQFLYRSQSDLFGRYLGGYGGSTTEEAPGKSGGTRLSRLRSSSRSRT